MHNNIAERLTSAYQQIAEITAKCQREALNCSVNRR